MREYKASSNKGMFKISWTLPSCSTEHSKTSHALELEHLGNQSRVQVGTFRNSRAHTRIILCQDHDRQHFHPAKRPGRSVQSDTNSASSGSILATQQLWAKTKSLPFQPLSIARYPFTQLSGLRRRGENEADDGCVFIQDT